MFSISGSWNLGLGSHYIQVAIIQDKEQYFPIGWWSRMEKVVIPLPTSLYSKCH